MKRILVPTDFQHMKITLQVAAQIAKKLKPKFFLIHMLKYQAKLTTL
jgi:hypothetical protein